MKTKKGVIYNVRVMSNNERINSKVFWCKSKNCGNYKPHIKHLGSIYEVDDIKPKQYIQTQLDKKIDNLMKVI